MTDPPVKIYLEKGTWNVGRFQAVACAGFPDGLAPWARHPSAAGRVLSCWAAGGGGGRSVGARIGDSAIHQLLGSLAIHAVHGQGRSRGYTKKGSKKSEINDVRQNSSNSTGILFQT